MHRLGNLREPLRNRVPSFCVEAVTDDSFQTRSRLHKQRGMHISRRRDYLLQPHVRISTFPLPHSRFRFKIFLVKAHVDLKLQQQRRLPHRRRLERQLPYRRLHLARWTDGKLFQRTYANSLFSDSGWIIIHVCTELE